MKKLTMTKLQRDILKELINASIEEKEAQYFSPRLANAEEAFEEAFGNEDEGEDDHEHI